MSADTDLIDQIKNQFHYATDLEVSVFLGVNKDTISAIRNNRTVIGESLRCNILEKWIARDCASSDDSIFSVQKLLAKLIDLRSVQGELRGTVGLVKDPTVCEDAALIDLYKAYKNISTDGDLANVLGIKRNSISMVRHGNSRLGPLPRVRIYGEIFSEDTAEFEAALKSSDVLLELVKRDHISP